MATWEMWDTTRMICGYDPCLTLGECAAAAPGGSVCVADPRARGSARPDTATAAVVDGARAVARRARPAPVAPGVNAHREREGVPRAAQGPRAHSRSSTTIPARRLRSCRTRTRTPPAPRNSGPRRNNNAGAEGVPAQG